MSEGKNKPGRSFGGQPSTKEIVLPEKKSSDLNDYG